MIEGETYYELLPSQREFLEIPHEEELDVAIYQGGFGSGKTFAGSLLGVLLSLKYPGVRGLVGAKTYPLVRDTTLRSYFEHLENFGKRECKDYVFRKSEQKLIFRNGSEVIFRHFEEAHKLKSLNLGFVEIEEMSEIPESTFKMLLGRMRQSKRPNWKKFRYRIFGHTNPEWERGWIYRTFYESKAPNYRFIIASTKENKFLPKNFCEEMKKIYDETYYRVNVLGEWAENDTNTVVKGFSEANIREISYQKSLPLHISCDFNVDPMCWVLAHRTEGAVYFFDEIVLENTTTERASEEFLRRYGGHEAEIIINGDASGDNRSCTSEYSNYVIMLNKLRGNGLENVRVEIKSFNPPIKNRVAAFNSFIKTASGEIKLFVSPKCEKLIYNLRSLKYKVGTSIIDVPSCGQIKTDSKLKFLSHPFDAASYLVDFYWPIVLKPL